MPNRMSPAGITASPPRTCSSQPGTKKAPARLVPRGQYYFVEDLGSTNGTFLNDRQVTDAQLRMDSRLRIGDTTFRYEE